jgi:hypothetical protein
LECHQSTPPMRHAWRVSAINSNKR